jgi:hypothetical protein
MATGQTMLDLMEVMDRGLQLQSGETGVSKALKALNASQDHFESILALEPNVYGSTVGTFTTSADTESTTMPTTLMRLDRLQYIDSGTSKPAWDLDRVGATGDYYHTTVPLITAPATTGKPVKYWTNGKTVYWSPVPDAVYTIRYYGFVPASDITASGTFAYPDMALMPMATFATKLLRTGKDDDGTGVNEVGAQVFGPVIQALGRFNRDRAPGYDYRYTHST